MNLNRREFLTTTLAAAAVPVIPAIALPGDSGPIKLAVATYSLRNFKRPEAIKMIQELGIKFADVKEFHIPIKDATPEEWKQDAKEFRDAGIKLVACGNVDMKKPEEQRRAFEYAKTCGFPTIVCAPTEEQLPAIEKLVKEYNIKIAIHNHGPEDKFFSTPKMVYDAVKNMDPRMGLCIDIGHTARTGADVVESIQMAGPRQGSQGSAQPRLEGRTRQPGERRRWRAAHQGDLPSPHQAEVPGLLLARIRNQRQRSAGRHETVFRLHAESDR